MAKRAHDRTRMYHVAHAFCRAMLGVWRMRGFGADNIPAEGPALLACNHQSYLDPVIAGAFTTRTLHYMARDTLFSNRYFGWLIRKYNAFPVKRGSADVGAIKESLRLLRAGSAVLLFPEGTRSRDGRIARMHPGVVAIARRSGAPIIPVAVEGAFEVWPRNRWLPRWIPAYVKYGPPITQTELSALDDRAAADVLTTRVRALQNDLRVCAGREAFEYDEEGIEGIVSDADR